MSRVGLSTDEDSLLSERQDITGEPIEVSRIKLMNPIERHDFLAKIELIGNQKKTTVDFLLKELLKVKVSDGKERQSIINEKPKKTESFSNVEVVVEEEIIWEDSLSSREKRDLITVTSRGILDLLEGVSYIAEANEISTRELLLLLATKEKENRFPDDIDIGLEATVSYGLESIRSMAKITYLSTQEFIQMLLITENQLQRFLTDKREKKEG